MSLPLILATLSLAALTVYWWGFTGRLLLHTYRSVNSLSQYPPVSLIIAVKNEAKQLPELFGTLETLHYPKLEIILVDDASEDGSRELMEGWVSERSDAKVVLLSGNNVLSKGKKKALLAGIGASSHEFLLFTDADGRPSSDRWPELMVAPCINEGADVVLGTGPIRGGRGLAALFASFDALFIALQYGAFALWGIPYMGVGRNLLYRRSWFERTDAFASHMDLPSGDDDLPIDHFAHKGKVRLAFSPDAAVYSRPPADMKAWFRQKARHLSTSLRYRPVTRFLLLAFELAGFTFFLSLVLLVLAGPVSNALVFIIAYLLISWPVCGLAAQRIGMKVPIIFMPLMAWVRPVLYIIAWSMVKRQKHEW